MTTSILSETFVFRNAEYLLDLRHEPKGFVFRIQQTIFHLNGSKEEHSIEMPPQVLEQMNTMMERVAEAKRKETEAKDPPVPINQRDKLTKAYLQGVSISNLSRSYGYSAKAIIAMLKAAGLYVRE